MRRAIHCAQASPKRHPHHPLEPRLIAGIAGQNRVVTGYAVIRAWSHAHPSNQLEWTTMNLGEPKI